MFPGFPRPTNISKWRNAIRAAEAGEQVLLHKSMASILSPVDLYDRGDDFRWIHKVSEIRRCKQKKWLHEVPHGVAPKAPIVMLGFTKFEYSSKIICIPCYDGRFVVCCHVLYTVLCCCKHYSKIVVVMFVNRCGRSTSWRLYTQPYWYSHQRPKEIKNS